MVIWEDGDWAVLEQLAALVKQTIRGAGLGVHKEELGPQVRGLGMLLGAPLGSLPAVVPGPEKQWLAIEALRELGRSGRASARSVESTVSLATWMCMIRRPLLAILDETYVWTRENRDRPGMLQVPR
eukprot:5097653-Lingulodinium_polyedra.AAC.1